jgi:hypothetical protein
VYVHPEIRAMMLRDIERELDRILDNADLRPSDQPTGAPRTEPVVLRLFWQVGKAGSRPAVRAAWVR